MQTGDQGFPTDALLYRAGQVSIRLDIANGDQII